MQKVANLSDELLYNTSLSQLGLYLNPARKCTWSIFQELKLAQLASAHTKLSSPIGFITLLEVFELKNN